MENRVTMMAVWPPRPVRPQPETKGVEARGLERLARDVGQTPAGLVEEFTKAKATKKVAKTKSVRRGFALVLDMLRASQDNNSPPTATMVAKWKASARRDYEAALAYIEQQAIRVQ
jgi:hypothetical protein